MTQSSGTVAGAPALSFPQRVIGVFVSPRATFESVVSNPKWFDVLALGIVVGMIAWGIFLWSASGSQIFIDQMVSQTEAQTAARGGDVAQAVERARNFFPVIRLIIVAGAPIIGPIFTAIVAGVLFGVFAALFGGGGSYKQVFSIVVHAGLAFQAAGLAELALQYARGSMAARLSLGALVQMLPEDSFVFLLLNAITLGWIWYLVLLAMGLAVLYRRKTATIATGFLSLYFVIVLIVAVFKSRA
jgi:Yip1 domain